jgi:hypothetical protein
MSNFIYNANGNYIRNMNNVESFSDYSYTGENTEWTNSRTDEEKEKKRWSAENITSRDFDPWIEEMKNKNPSWKYNTPSAKKEYEFAANLEEEANKRGDGSQACSNGVTTEESCKKYAEDNNLLYKRVDVSNTPCGCSMSDWSNYIPNYGLMNYVQYNAHDKCKENPSDHDNKDYSGYSKAFNIKLCPEPFVEKEEDSDEGTINAGGCLECADGYGTVHENDIKSCFPYKANCSFGTKLPQNKRIADSPNCETCHSDHYLKDRSCIKCDVCGLGNTEEDTTCTSDNNRTCKKCEKPDNSSFSGANGCEWSCDNGFRKEGNMCLPYEATCDVNTGTAYKQAMRTDNGPNCVSCKKGYYMLNESVKSNTSQGSGMEQMQAMLGQIPAALCAGQLGPELKGAAENVINNNAQGYTCQQGVGTLVQQCATKCLKSKLNPSGFEGDLCNESDSGLGDLSCKQAMTQAGLSQGSVNQIIASISGTEAFANYEDKNINEYWNQIPKSTLQQLREDFGPFMQNVITNFEGTPLGTSDGFMNTITSCESCVNTPLGRDGECSSDCTNVLNLKDKDDVTALEYFDNFNTNIKNKLKHFLDVDPTNKCLSCTPCNDRNEIGEPCSQYNDTVCKPCTHPEGAEFTNKIDNNNTDYQLRQKSNCAWNCKVDYKLNSDGSGCVDWNATCKNGKPNDPRKRTSDGPNCSTCDEGFYLVNGDCIKCKDGCGPKNTEETTACTTQSDRVCSQCNLPEFSTHKNDNGCDWTCNNGYYKEGKICKPFNATCSNGTPVPQEARIQDGSNCLDCKTEYYINKEDKTCNICTDKCTGHTEETQQCTGTTNRVCSDCPAPPDNGKFAEENGCTWICKQGFYKDGGKCLPCTDCSTIEGNQKTQEGGNCTADANALCEVCTLPSNSEYDTNKGCNWSCQEGFYKDNDECKPCTQCDKVDGNKEVENQCSANQNATCKDCVLPENAKFDNSTTCSWTCNSGYNRNGDMCEVFAKTCNNGTVVPIQNRTSEGPNCTEAGCNEGYYYLNGECVECTKCTGATEENTPCSSTQNRVCSNCNKPDNSVFTSGCDWECDKNFIKSGDKCVPNNGYQCNGNDECSSGVCKGGSCCVKDGNGDDPLCEKCNNKDSAYPGHCTTCINHGSDNIWNKDLQPSPVQGKGNWDCVAKPSKTNSSSGKTCLPWKTAQGGRQKWFAKNDSDNRCGDPDGSGFDWCYTSNGSSNYWEACQGSSNK